MQRALTLFDSTIGKKVVMAVSGVVLFGFVLGHMAGNLQVFLGPAKLNAYAKAIHDTAPLLWGTRITLLVAVIAHVVSAMQLRGRNQAARGGNYAVKKDHVTDYAAKTMMLSGPIVLAYLLFHLAHLTVGVAMGSGYSHSATDVYANVVNGFKVPWVTAFYVIANLLLGMHLFHGLWSFFQSLGLNHPKHNAKRRMFAIAFAGLITTGNVVMPIACLVGIVPAPATVNAKLPAPAAPAKLERRDPWI